MALLKQLKSEPIIKKDITARRTQAGKATYATFSRAEQFKIKSRNNPLVQQFARASLIAIGSQVMSTIKSEDARFFFFLNCKVPKSFLPFFFFFFFCYSSS